MSRAIPRCWSSTAGETVARVADGPRVVWNVHRLVDAAKMLGLPVAATEQYPQGLGPTWPSWRGGRRVPSKFTFSCGGCGEVFADFRSRGSTKSWFAGSRPTCASLDGVRSAGRRLAGVCGGRRGRLRFESIAARPGAHGFGRGALTTVEAAMFEWCESAGRPSFRRSAGWRASRGHGEVSRYCRRRLPSPIACRKRREIGDRSRLLTINRSADIVGDEPTERLIWRVHTNSRLNQALCRRLHQRARREWARDGAYFQR